MLRNYLGGNTATSVRKFIATALGSVPVLGGTISAASGVMDDIVSKDKEKLSFLC